jgi:hypothetical protein
MAYPRVLHIVVGIKHRQPSLANIISVKERAVTEETPIAGPSIEQELSTSTDPIPIAASYMDQGSELPAKLHVDRH